MADPLETLLDEYGRACSDGNEYDNRERIAETRQAVLDEVVRLLEGEL
jgi:hypothetical protein